MRDLPFPRSLPEFQRLFPDDAACAAYLETARWREGFVCPRSTRLRPTRACIPGIGTTQRLVVMGENRIGMVGGTTGGFLTFVAFAETFIKDANNQGDYNRNSR